MKNLLFILPLLFALSAAAQSIYIATLPGSAVVLLYAEQLAGHSVQVQVEQGVGAGWYESAAYDCYPTGGLVVASYPADFPQTSFRSLNTPCTAVRARAAGGVVRPLTKAEQRHRFTIRGVTYRLEPLPAAHPDEVRRFRAIKVP